MTLDERIRAKRLEIQQLEAERDLKRQELHALFLERATELCPIPIGTRVEYEPGKHGQVDRIGYHMDWNELDLNRPVQWTVTGKKINRTGDFGVKDFHPVGPATHRISGTSFTFSGLAHALGLDDGAA